MVKKKGLGRGLDALLPDWSAPGTAGNGILLLDPREIRPNPYQPRRTMDPEGLQELARSIREKGVIQPLIVRSSEDGYELIAGERRLRASLAASLETVPVIVKDVAPAEMLELALIENIQREELNALEEAEAYARLIEEFNLTQEELSTRVGKKRATITNYLRLRKLPDPIKNDLLEGRISMGHARAVLSVDSRGQMMDLRDEIVRRDLSVRAAEKAAARIKDGKKSEPGKAASDPALEEIGRLLTTRLGTRVIVSRRGRKGSITIGFHSDEDLDRLLNLLGR